MVRRIAAAILWFIAGGWSFNLVGMLLGFDPSLGATFGAALGAFIGADPLGLIWPAEGAQARTIRASSISRHSAARSST